MRRYLVEIPIGQVDSSIAYHYLGPGDYSKFGYVRYLIPEYLLKQFTALRKIRTRWGKSQAWKSLGYGPGQLEDFEYRPQGKYWWRVRGNYTVYTPYGDSEVFVDLQIEKKDGEEKPSYETVIEEVNYFLDDHPELWEVFDDVGEDEYDSVTY